MLRLRAAQTRMHRVQSNKVAMVNNTKTNKLINYFYSSNNIDTDKTKSKAMTQRIHKAYGKVFNGIGCFKGTFSLQPILDSKPYQAPPRCIAYVLQKLFEEEHQQL